MKAVNADAAIAQQVERILGKDEVASSNLAISSKKALTPFGVRAFFYLYIKSNWRPHPILIKEVACSRQPQRGLVPLGKSGIGSKKALTPLNSTPFVRQYGILLTNGVMQYAKREAKQEIHRGV